jgi:hypothetical protein
MARDETPRHHQALSDAAEMMRKNTAVAERIRDTAYFLWEQDGSPPGRSFDYWLRAKEALQRELAYDKWLAEGTPTGRADEHWHAARAEIEGK